MLRRYGGDRVTMPEHAKRLTSAIAHAGPAGTRPRRCSRMQDGRTRNRQAPASERRERFISVGIPRPQGNSGAVLPGRGCDFASSECCWRRCARIASRRRERWNASSSRRKRPPRSARCLDLLSVKLVRIANAPRAGRYRAGRMSAGARMGCEMAHRAIDARDTST